MRQFMNLFMRLSHEGDVKIYSEKDLVQQVTAVGFSEVHWEKITKRSFLLTATNGGRG